MSATVNTTMNIASAVNVIATLAGFLPVAAAGMSVLWLGLQIWVFFKKKSWRK